MNKKNKIILITAGALASLAIIYLTVRNLALSGAEATDATLDATKKLISDLPSDDTIIEDDVTRNADANKGTNASGTNKVDAVRLDNVIWLGGTTSGIYNANNGDFYDDNMQLITYSDGTTAAVNPDDVIYGYYDYDNQVFINE